MSLTNDELAIAIATADTHCRKWGTANPERQQWQAQLSALLEIQKDRASKPSGPIACAHQYDEDGCCFLCNAAAPGRP